MVHSIHNTDAMEALPKMPDCSFDACLCDPPYGIKFMGKGWDHGVPSQEVWAEVLRVLKPGAVLLAFGGTRTSHRLVCAIEDAGFEIRDSILWLYGSGFPKSHDISKALDKAAGVTMESRGHFQYTQADEATTPGAFRTNEERRIPGCLKAAPATPLAKRWDGYGTALKPAHEPICLAMKPLDGTFAENAVKWGVAGLNVDGCRVGCEVVGWGGDGGGAGIWNESSCGLRQEGDARPVAGRWPANVIHDGSDEVLEGFPMTAGQIGGNNDPHGSMGYHGGATGAAYPGVKDSGSAARFFYCAKASRGERNAGCEGLVAKQTMGGGGLNNTPDNVCSKYGSIKAIATNHHPTIKPLALTKYLAALCLPPKRDTPRRILIPFSGSGSEMIGALLAGWEHTTGIENDTEQGYIEIAKARLAYWQKAIDKWGTPLEPADVLEAASPTPTTAATEPDELQRELF